MTWKPPFPLAILIALALVFGSGACQPASAVLHSPSTPANNPPAGMQCPDGRPARSGLQNFGAYIGTWQGSRTHDSQFPSDYVIGTIPGHVAVRCSKDGYVIAEQIHPLFQSPAGQALRVALSDIPDDGKKVYDHVHARCRVLQYSSLELAHQLGADDPGGQVDISFESDGAYNSASVKLILIDLLDEPGADTRVC